MRRNGSSLKLGDPPLLYRGIFSLYLSDIERIRKICTRSLSILELLWGELDWSKRRFKDGKVLNITKVLTCLNLKTWLRRKLAMWFDWAASISPFLHPSPSLHQQISWYVFLAFFFSIVYPLFYVHNLVSSLLFFMFTFHFFSACVLYYYSYIKICICIYMHAHFPYLVHKRSVASEKF